MPQLTLSFNDFVHHAENNSASQNHLDQNRGKFHGQCQLICDLIHSGVHLSVRDAVLKYGISSLPRRMKDLSDKGIVFKQYWVEKDGKKMYKVWCKNV